MSKTRGLTQRSWVFLHILLACFTQGDDVEMVRKVCDIGKTS